jgi:hypothetical protein
MVKIERKVSAPKKPEPVKVKIEEKKTVKIR